MDWRAAIYLRTTLLSPLGKINRSHKYRRGLDGIGHFIPGVRSVEDLAQISGTCWIVGSGQTTLGFGMDDPAITKNYLHLLQRRLGVAEPFNIRELRAESKLIITRRVKGEGK